MGRYTCLTVRRRVHTWRPGNNTVFTRNRDLLPLHEHRRTEILYSYREITWPTAIPALPPADPAAAPSTATPSASVPLMSYSGYSATRRRITSSQAAAPFANPGTPPEDPFTPPADSDMGFFSFQPLGASSSPAGAASSSIGPHAQVPDNFHPAPQGSSVPGLPLSFTAASTFANPNPTSNRESLDRIRSVPVLLSVTYLRGHYRGSTNYHYLLPPPPGVDPIHLHGGRVAPGPPMLPVSADAREGLLRDAWLDVGMDTVWEELMMSLIAEYAGAIGDIGLSIWEWRWVKTEWNMEAVCR